MSATHGNITAFLRNKSGKSVARQLRSRGMVPGVVYGPGREPVSMYLDPKAFQQAMDPARGFNTLFRLVLADEEKGGKSGDPVPCVVVEHQIDVLRDNVTHVDFLRVDPDQPIERSVPVNYTGRAAGVAAGGVLKPVCREVKIAVKPGDVPAEIEVDVTPLEAGHSLRARDIEIDNVTLVTDPDQVMVAVVMPRKEVTETPEEEAAAAEGAEAGDEAQKPAAEAGSN